MITFRGLPRTAHTNHRIGNLFVEFVPQDEHSKPGQLRIEALAGNKLENVSGSVLRGKVDFDIPGDSTTAHKQFQFAGNLAVPNVCFAKTSSSWEYFVLRASVAVTTNEGTTTTLTTVSTPFKVVSPRKPQPPTNTTTTEASEAPTLTVPGVGKQIANALTTAGIHTVGQLAECTSEMLPLLLGHVHKPRSPVGLHELEQIVRAAQAMVQTQTMQSTQNFAETTTRTVDSYHPFPSEAFLPSDEGTSLMNHLNLGTDSESPNELFR